MLTTEFYKQDRKGRLFLDFMRNAINKAKTQSGRVLVPILLWWAGLPLGFVLLLWFFFFRG